MKLADRVIETHSAGVQSASGFTIAQTSKMFKILSDSLYSDKVMAVIRELSTNAYDSHISAGNKNPFKVTLPTAANPNFIVRDYGTGLSQKDMESLYTTYGASNKNDSNDFVGCLGLGSKSPFAYTKSFTTSSYFNGTKYTYIAAIDDSGVPTLNLFNTADTDEPNGLEISFAVKTHDFSEFTNKAIRIFHYFKMKPIIEGGVNPNLVDHKYSNRNIVISGDGWRVCRLNNDNNYFPSNYHRIDSGIVAIMGNIAYPVQANQLVGQEKIEQPDHIAKWNRAFQKADIDSWKSFVGEIINAGLYLELDFGIGELEMDVSREGLQYTKSVIKTLRQKTQEIYLEMKDEFSKKIANAKTKVEAICLYYDMNDLAGGWGVGATWTDPNGKSHNINSGNDLEYKIGAGKALYVFNYKSTGYRSRRLVSMTDKIHHETLTGKGYSYWNSTKKSGKMAFFICDVKGEETAKKIITRYCNQNDCFAYMLLDTKDYTQSDKGFDKLIEDVGQANLLKVSDYKHLTQSSGPRKKGIRNSNGAVSDQDVFFIHGQSKDSGKLSVEYNDALNLKTLTSDELDEFSDSDSIIYVPILRYQSTPEFPKINKITSLFDNENIKGLFGDVKIYAIKSNFVAKMTSEGYNLIDFNTWFKKILSTKIKDYFNNTNEYNSIVEFYKKEFITKDDDNGNNYYWNHGTLVSQFSCHMLSIYGLDYKNYIKNTELCNIIDSFLVMEFFADTMHRPTFDLKRFSQTEYFDHINSLLKDRGVDNLDSKELKKKNVQYNTLINIQHQMFDHSDDVETYTKLFKSETKVTKHKLAKVADLKKILKVEVDKNPMLKYIMGSNQHNGNLRDLDSKNNPISQFADSYYGKRNTAWVESMDSDKVELFKIQLSSLIK
jgi:hypothetical protein